MQLHLVELSSFFLCCDNFLLNDNLLVPVTLLEFSQLANSQNFSLVASESLTHGQLILVATQASFTFLNLAIRHCELLASGRQRLRTILSEKVSLGR